jgi:hypothetical protein
MGRVACFVTDLNVDLVLRSPFRVVVPVNYRCRHHPARFPEKGSNRPGSLLSGLQ